MLPALGTDLLWDGMVFLSYYKIVNRGMGWLNSFLATNCVKTQKKKVDDITNSEEVGAADTERQDLKTITLTELRKAARAGDFLEV